MTPRMPDTATRRATDMAPAQSETTYQQTVAHFTRSRRAAAKLAWWRALPGKEPVARFAERLTSRAIYAVTPEDIERACEETRHALEWPNGRGLRRSVAEGVPEVADWYPNFPLVHSLYFATESLGRPPLWDELIEMWRGEGPLREMLGLPARRAMNAAIAAGHSAADAEEAMWWRLGNAYYSTLRELYVLAVLRQAGLPAEYHVIADALFRADFWLGDIVISLFVANAQYRDGGGAGRKQLPRDILGDCPDFTFVDMPRLTRREYGTVHLPSRAEIEQFAEQFHA
jgi:hypothetical protein